MDELVGCSVTRLVWVGMTEAKGEEWGKLSSCEVGSSRRGFSRYLKVLGALPLVGGL